MFPHTPGRLQPPVPATSPASAHHFAHTPAPRRRRPLVLSTAVLAIGSLTLSSCGGGDWGGADADAADVDMDEVGVGAMEDFSAGDTFVASEPVDFSMLYRDHPNYPIDTDWMFFEQLEDEHNVNISTENAPLSDWEERRSLVIGAGEMPDFIPVMYPGDETQFISGGSVLPVSDYLDYMPHLSEKIDEWDLEDDFDSLYQEDGKFYVLPGIHQEPFHQYSIAVRWDIWEELGYDEPETWDEFAEQLRGVQEVYPDMIPYSERWEMEAALSTVAPTFGTQAGWEYGDGMHYDEDADEFVYAAATDEYRELLEYFAGLVDEGLMDSESITQDDEQAMQKFASGQSAAIGANDQEILQYRTSIEEVGDEDMDVRLIPTPAGPAGNVAPGGQLESGMALSSTVAEEEHFIALLQFLDWLYYSDEGLEFSKWGVEGETFEREGEERVLDENIDFQDLNPDGEENLQVDYGFHNGAFMLAQGSTSELVESMAREEVVEFREAMLEKEPLPIEPARPLDEVELEEASLTQNTLDDTVSTATAQFITGARDLENWDEFVAELEGQGLEDFVELHNDAYQRAQEEIDGVEEDVENGEG